MEPGKFRGPAGPLPPGSLGAATQRQSAPGCRNLLRTTATQCEFQLRGRRACGRKLDFVPADEPRWPAQFSGGFTAGRKDGHGIERVPGYEPDYVGRTSRADGRHDRAVYQRKVRGNESWI